MPKIIINEFYRGGNLTTTNEFIEFLLLEDLTATELQAFFVGDSAGTKTSKFSAYQFTNMSFIASTFQAGTIITVGGTGAITQNTSYNPSGGDWNIELNAGGSFLPNANAGNPGDIATDDIVWVDTANIGSTISADGFAVDIGAAIGAFTNAANVNFGSSTNNTGYALNSDFAGITNIANWTTGITFAAITPGLPNGGANTTYINSLRSTSPNPSVVKKIHEVQGSGNTSPLAGQPATIEGVVIADFQLNDQLRGFFIQEEDTDIDGNSATSEAIFVFTGSNPPLDVQEGQIVRVTGNVSEFFNMTQISATTAGSITLVNGGNNLSLVTPTIIDLPATGDINAFYEQYEGMLVQFADKLYVSEYFELARYGQIVLTADGRPFQYSHTDNTPTAAEYTAFLDDLNRKRIILDDDDNIQNSPLNDGVGKFFYPQPDGFSTGTQGTNYFRGGDTISNLTGVLHWSFAGQSGTDAWRIRPTQANPITFTVENPRPATPPDVGGNIKVASFNVLNYFNSIDTVGGNGSPRGADSVDEFNRQNEKLISALIALNADVIGLMEIENNGDTPTPAVKELVDRLNTQLGGDIYSYVDTVKVGTDQITVALLYKIAVLEPKGAAAILTNTAFTDPNNTGQQRNRPAIAQTFNVIAQNNPDFGESFNVVVNHFKSKGGNDATGADIDQNDGQGQFNDTRTKAANYLVNTWIPSDPTGQGDADFLIIGDINAYKGETPITTIKNAGYTDLIENYNGNDAYGYVFNGQLGYLDHALANSSLTPQVTGVAKWHINADEVPVFDYNNTVDDGAGEASFEAKPTGNNLYEANAFRTSDHDPVIIGLNLNTPTPPNMQITEFIYSGTDGEFIEFTNLGTNAVDLTGWSFDNNSRTPGLFSLSGFGIVQPGESIILTESNAEAFRIFWGLPANVKIIGGLTENLGRNNEINLYDNNGNLIDRLTYGDETFPGTVRTQNTSAWTELANLDAQTITANWKLSTVGDGQNSYVSLAGDIGNPGSYISNQVVIPSITITQSDNSTNVTEGGATDSYNVVLNAQPSQEVTININVDSQVTTDKTTLIFTPNTWNIPQTVTVTATDDTTVEGGHFSNITHTIGETNLGTVKVSLSDNDFGLLRKIGSFAGQGAEITDYDPTTKRLFVVDGTAFIRILDFSDPTNLTEISSIDLTAYGSQANSVAVKNGIVAIAVEATDKTNPGKVVFFDTAGTFLKEVTVGALPDMVTFSPDGTKVLTANEGEPGTVDPEGSISIIDISQGVANATIATATFTSFNGQEVTLRTQGVRIFPGNTVAQDVEPEYITFSEDGTKAWVTLQENNAVAVVDIATATVEKIVPLGKIDHNQTGNEIDPSDRDGGININKWPVFGLFMPDAIASFTANGATYYITANEGDAREEEARVKDLILDSTAFPDATTLQQDANLGRLTVSNIDGDTDGDGDYDQLYAYGTRSFSIWDAQGQLVYNSGSNFEQQIAQQVPSIFNLNGEDIPAGIDNRSDNKGPEPEGVTVGVIDGKTYAFIGLERTGGIMVYDVTNPQSPQFIEYVPNSTGDLAPEGLKFIPATDSPNGKNLLVVANEVSKTIAVYEVNIFNNLAPTDLILSATNVDENVADNTVIGTFSTVDQNQGDTFTYFFVEGGVDNSFFTIGGANGDQLLIKQSPDFETKSSYNIRVRTTDKGGLFLDQFLVINVNDLPDTQPNPQTQLLNPKDDVFTISGINAKVQLKVQLSGRNSNLVNELGVFTVDDENGTINGIAPGAAGYTEAALERSQVVFSIISNNPNGFEAANLSRLLEFESNQNLRFYLIKNSTFDTVKQTSSTSNILFSDTTIQQITSSTAGGFALGWKDGSNTTVTEFNDLVVDITATDEPTVLGTSLQGAEQAEVIDLRGVNNSVYATFTINREAAFDNFIGFYRITDASGGIDTNNDGVADILTGQSGYIQAAINQRVTDISLTVGNQATATYNGTFSGNAIFAPFIIVNGRTEALLDTDSSNDPAVYFPYLGANSDQADHIRLLGDNVFGFEDLPGGGDADYNDMIVRINLTTIG